MNGELDRKQADEWAWWQRALAEPHRIGDPSLPLHADSPELGFYRINSKRLGRWVPIAFFKDDAGRWCAERDGKPVDPDKVEGLWTWACRNPTTYPAYEKAVAGDGYDDEPPHGIGHNLPADSDMDERDRLWLEFSGERDLALEFLKTPIVVQAEADRAAIWAKRLAEIVRKADGLHEVEKRPHLEAGRRVDDRWRDLREEPLALAKRLKRHQTAFLQELDRQEQERQRAAAVEAERLRREAAAAAAAAATPEALADAGKAVAAAKEAEREAEYRPPSAGRVGAKVSLRVTNRAAILDWSALCGALIERQEVKDYLQGLADKAARAGVALPGCQIVQEKRAV